MTNLIQTFKDFLSFRFLMFSLLPLIISSAIFITLLGIFMKYLASIDLNEEAFNFFLGTLILHAIQVFIMLIGGTVAGFLSMHLSVIFALFIISFLTPLIVREINLKHYNYNKLDEISFTHTLFLLLKVVLKFLVMLFFVLISFLIPVVQFFSYILLFFLMFYIFFQFLMIDVASCVLNRQDFLRFNPYKACYIGWVFVFYLVCNIPWLGLFLPVIFVIFLTHQIYQNELIKKHERLDFK